ncbi:MAG: hypothetical protein IJA94_03750 [Bacilli bacterium]|nr:hypothetical protein [Bacilli bacterium]
MKDVYGSTWTLQLMIGFILLFVAFLTLTITYSKVFKVKNEVISIIEKYQGYTDVSAEIINNYLRNSGYMTMGRCVDQNNPTENPMLGINDYNDINAQNVTENENYFYCIEQERKQGFNDSLTRVNYEVTLFYSFNVPILGDIARFTVKGKTSDMIDRKDQFD